MRGRIIKVGNWEDNITPDIFPTNKCEIFFGCTSYEENAAAEHRSIQAYMVLRIEDAVQTVF